MRRCKYGIANTTLQMGQRKWAVAIGGVAKPGQPNGVGRPGPFLPACQAQRRHKNGAAVTPPWRKPCRGAMQHGTPAASKRLRNTAGAGAREEPRAGRMWRNLARPVPMPASHFQQAANRLGWPKQRHCCPKQPRTRASALFIRWFARSYSHLACAPRTHRRPNQAHHRGRSTRHATSSISKQFSIHLHLIVLYIEHYSQILPAFQRYCSSISFNPCRTGCGLF